MHNPHFLTSKNRRSIQQAVTTLENGGIIAYPTEAVYGLGCDPQNKEAVLRILKLKNRHVDKGLILIASSWNDVEQWIEPLNKELLDRAFATWPGPITWIFPASPSLPNWISGLHTVAIRITAHPIARELCQQFRGALVSTSANPEGQPPAKDIKTLHHYFSNNIDFILEGNLGTLKQPTEIRDIITGKILRSRNNA